MRIHPVRKLTKKISACNGRPLAAFSPRSGPSRRVLLYRMLFCVKSENNNSLTEKATVAMVLLYTGYLLWYALTRYVLESADDYWLSASFLSVTVCAFLAMYCLPGWFFTSRYVKDVLYYPVSSRTILSTLMTRVLMMQFCICMFLSYPLFLFCAENRLFTAKTVLASLAVVCATDFIVILLYMIVCVVCSSRIVGYVFITFQYLSFLLLFITGTMTASRILHPDFLLRADKKIHSLNMFLFAVPVMIVPGMIVTFVFNSWYTKAYVKMQNFRKRSVLKHILPECVLKIIPMICTPQKHPYFFMEWKRLCQNKELLFFSNVKNIITIIVLYRLLARRSGQISLTENYAAELFLLATCCGTNTISSTAYSSDPNRKYYAHLPVSFRRSFMGKTIQGFLWSEIMVFLFGLIMILLKNIPLPDACLLFLSGTFTNYACSFAGVLLDFKMPRTVHSTNELLHGNISKVIVLAASAALTAGELYVTGTDMISVPLLPLSVIISIFLIIMELCCLLFCKGVFYDTDT